METTGFAADLARRGGREILAQIRIEKRYHRHNT